MAKKIKTIIEKPQSDVEQPMVQTIEVVKESISSFEVELTEAFKDFKSLVLNHAIIEFKEGKSVVSNTTAEALRKSGFIK